MPASESSILSAPQRVALIGNPNTGKSTLFNALTGLNARVANFPGCTVEKKTGRMQFEGRTVELIDLPGTYSLAPRTLDEMVSVDVLLGRRKDVGRVDAVVCIVDASNLERNLYLLSQILDLAIPTILVLNMWDIAQARQVSIDVEGLRQVLGIPVIICEAHRRMGIEDVRGAIVHARTLEPPERPEPFPAEFYTECRIVSEQLETWNDRPDSPFVVERLLIDLDGQFEKSLSERHGEKLAERLKIARGRLAEAGCRLPVAEARVRYAWVRTTLSGLMTARTQRVQTRSDVLDRFLTHHITGLVTFALLMFVIFQALYSWSGPLMDLIEAGQSLVADRISSSVAPGPLRSLLVDGIVAGVGGVLIFLPQIAMLFLFIAILEDCGYLARAAFVMDRLMTGIGLSGKSFVPLMSSFACAIPGVMATRVIENQRDRMITILIAPLMSCSARLPVYVLMTTAFVPPIVYWNGLVGLQGITLFAMSSLGAVIAIPVAWLLKKTCFKGETPPFIMELPSYKWPSPRIVLARVLDRSKAFVVRAGTLIFATTIVIWASGYFPADHSELHALERQIERTERQLERSGSDVSEQSVQEAAGRLEQLNRQRNEEAGRLIEKSYLGIAGHTVEPVVRPLGWDWKIGVGVLASFPAREVIIATLGTIYSLGSEIDESDAGLVDVLREAKHQDGTTPVFNVVVACSIMVFFALCAQCASTLMVIRRETNSWRWPAFTFAYMTGLAYIGALLTYQLGMRLLG